MKIATIAMIIMDQNNVSLNQWNIAIGISYKQRKNPRLKTNSHLSVATGNLDSMSEIEWQYYKIIP